MIFFQMTPIQTNMRPIKNMSYFVTESYISFMAHIHTFPSSESSILIFPAKFTATVSLNCFILQLYKQTVLLG